MSLLTSCTCSVSSNLIQIIAIIIRSLHVRCRTLGGNEENNQCHHQIDRMKRRYDTMVEQDKKSGGCLYVEVLRHELNECFGALKVVTPDKVYSSRKGMLTGANLVPENEQQHQQ